LKGAKIQGCNVRISQDSQTVCQLDKIVGMSNTQQLVSTVKDAVAKTASEVDKGTKEMLATAVTSNNQNVTLETHITNIIETNFSDVLTTTCLASSSADQFQEIKHLDISCTGDNKVDMSLSQNIQLYQFASCVTTAVTNIISNDSIVTSVEQKASIVNDENKKGLFNEDMWKTIGILAAISVVIFLIFLYARTQLKP